MTETTGTGAGDWVAAAKKRQAEDADRMAAVASGIGEYGIANACYRLAAILRQHARGDYSSMVPPAPSQSANDKAAYKLVLVPASMIDRSETDLQFGTASMTSPGPFEIVGDVSPDKVIRVSRPVYDAIEVTEP